MTDKKLVHAKYTGTLPHISSSGATWRPDSYVGEVDANERDVSALFANGQLMEVDPALYASEDDKAEAEHQALVDEAKSRGIQGVLQRMNDDTLREKIAEHQEANPDFGDGENDDQKEVS